MEIEAIKEIKEIGKIWEKNGFKRLYFDGEFFTDYFGFWATETDAGNFRLETRDRVHSARDSWRIMNLWGLELHEEHDSEGKVSGYSFSTTAFFDFRDEKLKVKSGGSYNVLQDDRIEDLVKKIKELVA